MKKPLQLTFVSLAMVLVLAGCGSSATESEGIDNNLQRENQITEDVAATVEAAIALAVKATVSALDAGTDTDTASTASSNEIESAASTENASDTNAEAAHTETADTVAMAETTAVAADPTAVVQNTTEQTELPVLFTPTPDQSVAIHAYINANTRHFEGNPDAKVVLVEFGDFW